MNVRAIIESMPSGDRADWTGANLKIEDEATLDGVLRQVEQLDSEGLIHINESRRESHTGNRFLVAMSFTKA